MPPESQEPFYGQEQAFYTQIESANRVIARQRKIDPMGMMGKIFAIVGAILIVIGVLIAFLLARSNPGRFGFYFVTLAGAWATGLIFLLLGLTQLLFFRNVNSASVVDNYLRALVNQDYAAAFQYLDPGIMTRQGDLTSQTWFTQRAQAYDERGKITDYALKGFSLNPRSAMYTIKIIRGDTSYTVHLALSKRGDTWKISGFDLF
ncbi:MAG TPA: hypothetical protein VKV37_01895 [Ktedonobacteraceae bacterium]|jgi:hypothetical protein|nr:hypothetical protein [Ktedonobacteraceae bacterium]